MSEYIVDFGDASEEYIAFFGRMAERVAGNPIHEEIIRCKDCLYFKQTTEFGICEQPEFLPLYAEADGFCSWGKRKEDSK